MPALKKRLDAWRAKQTKSVAKNAEMKTLDKPVKPGGMIGIIGGGQLGRMLALAAARLGLKTCIYNDETRCARLPGDAAAGRGAL